MTTTEPKYPDIVIDLSNVDGNAMSIIAACQRVARRAGVPREELNTFFNEATSGDYDNVIQTCMKWFEIDM